MLSTLIRKLLHAPGLVLVALLVLVLAGIFEYRQMPVDAFPDISPVMVPVFAEAHGMAPEEVERLITYPIEAAMNGLPHVTRLKSTSAFGMAVIYVYFEDDVDIYFARQLVAERLAAASARLPELDEPPSLGPISTGLGQIFIYYLTADPHVVDTEGKELSTWLRELNDWVVKFQLQTVPGVTDVLSMGGHVLQYQVRVNPALLRKYELTLHHVVDAIRANNRNVGGQFLRVGAEEHLVRGVGLVEELEQLANVPLKSIRGTPVLLHEIAEVTYGQQIRRGVVTLNGEEEVVSGMVMKLYGENTSAVIDRLYDKVETVRHALPDGVTLVPYYEQAELVANATNTVKHALLQGGLLVILTLALLLGNWRTALIVALSLPVCALIAILCMNQYAISANLMSLAGIAVAIGMLGDGSIVMVENIFRHLGTPQHQHQDKRTVILGAVHEVARPVIFSVLIIVLVFLPLFTLEGEEGKMFSPMAFSISFALLGSLLMALFVVPVLALYFVRQAPQRENPLIRWCVALYQPLLALACRFRKSVLGLALLALLASLLALQNVGTEFIPTLEEGSILISATMAPSISLQEATRTVLTLEQQILQFDEVESTITRIGRPEAGSHPHPVNIAEIHLELKPPGTWQNYSTKARLIQALREQLSVVPGVQFNFTQPIQNAFDELLSGIRTQLAIRVYGEELDVLETKAAEIKQAIADVPGLVDLSIEQNFGQPQVQVIPDRKACARYGISVSQILELVELAVGGEAIDQVYLNTRRFDIHLRYQEPFRDNPEALRNLLLTTTDKDLIPLGQVATVKSVVGPIQINREKNQRRWIVQTNVRDRDIGSTIADIRQHIANEVDLPEGYTVEYGGQFEHQQRAMHRLALIVPLVVGGVFLMLWTGFGNVRHAAIIMVNVPLALVGGVLGLLIMQEYLSVPASVGFIALFGIAVQNGMVLVTYFNDLRDRGYAVDQAVTEGARLRLRPVLTTALTTILGLLPLLLATGAGAEVQRPLASVVVFGLTTSTLLTLFVIPACYTWLETARQRRL